MFPDKADETFANAYPAEWKRIVSEGKGQFRTRNGLFTFAVTDPEAELRRFSDMVRASTVPAPGGDVPAPYFWTLLSQVRPGALDAHTRDLLGKLFIGDGALFLAAAFGAWFLALAVSRRQVYQEQLVAAAMFDALTGLPNRKLFFDRLDTGLAAAGRYGRKLALVYVDLDGFKGVNDSMGHEAGDEVLKRVAAILSGAVRHSDTVSRLGGDEFALILNEINEAADAAMVGEKIVSLLGAPMGLAWAWPCSRSTASPPKFCSGTRTRPCTFPNPGARAPAPWPKRPAPPKTEPFPESAAHAPEQRSLGAAAGQAERPVDRVHVHGFADHRGQVV
jgi:GGDEF domain-containing protein